MRKSEIRLVVPSQGSEIKKISASASDHKNTEHIIFFGFFSFSMSIYDRMRVFPLIYWNQKTLEDQYQLPRPINRSCICLTKKHIAPSSKIKTHKNYDL